MIKNNLKPVFKLFYFSLVIGFLFTLDQFLKYQVASPKGKSLPRVERQAEILSVVGPDPAAFTPVSGMCVTCGDMDAADNRLFVAEATMGRKGLAFAELDESIINPASWDSVTNLGLSVDNQVYSYPPISSQTRDLVWFGHNVGYDSGNGFRFELYRFRVNDWIAASRPAYPGPFKDYVTIPGDEDPAYSSYSNRQVNAISKIAFDNNLWFSLSWPTQVTTDRQGEIYKIDPNPAGFGTPELVFNQQNNNLPGDPSGTCVTNGVYVSKLVVHSTKIYVATSCGLGIIELDADANGVPDDIPQINKEAIYDDINIKDISIDTINNRIFVVSESAPITPSPSVSIPRIPLCSRRLSGGVWQCFSGSGIGLPTNETMMSKIEAGLKTTPTIFNFTAMLWLSYNNLDVADYHGAYYCQYNSNLAQVRCEGHLTNADWPTYKRIRDFYSLDPLNSDASVISHQYSTSEPNDLAVFNVADFGSNPSASPSYSPSSSPSYSPDISPSPSPSPSLPASASPSTSPSSSASPSGGASPSPSVSLSPSPSRSASVSPSPSQSPSPSPSRSSSPSPSPSRSASPSPSSSPTHCWRREEGDANCDNLIDGRDFDTWQCEFITQVPCRPNPFYDPNPDSHGWYADFSQDNKISLIDFEIFRGNQ